MRAVPPVVRWIGRAACRIFYRVDRVGAAPPDGAALLLPNHPNALLDPAILWATADRDVRFLAKSPLFDGPLRPLLAAARAIPVYRRLDQGADLSKNAATFAAVDAALATGDAVCVFPEGLSHSTGRLEPLRTGAARMALNAERSGTRVAIVPIGLNFERKTAFRSRVTVVYGRAFSCRDLEGLDPVESVRALTTRIGERMRLLMVEADPDADAQIVSRVDRLYTAARGHADTSEQRVARRRVIAAGMQRLRSADPARYEDTLLRLRRYDQRLRRFGFRDRHLDWNITNADAIRFAARESLIAVPLLPVAMVAMVLFAIPYKATGVAGRRLATGSDVTATATVLSGAGIYGAWILALGAAAFWLFGARLAVVLLLVAPLTAIAGLFAIERETAVLDGVRAWFLLRRTRPGTRERLRRRRSELADVLEDVYEWLASEPA